MPSNNQQDNSQSTQEEQGIPVNVKMFKQYKSLDSEIKELDHRITALKSDRFVLGKEIVEYMEIAEIDKISIIGKLFYIKTQVIAKIADQPMFFNFLKSKKEEDIIKYSINARTLNSWAKEWREDGKLIPECLIIQDLKLIGMRKSS